MAKGNKKEPKVKYLKPPKVVKTVPLNYDPQTKVYDAFEDDLEFLLCDGPKVEQPIVDSVQSEPRRNQKKKKSNEAIKGEKKQQVNLTKESRREILDFDINFSSDDEQGQRTDQPRAGNKNHNELMNRFMENQLGIEIYQYQNDEIESTDVDSIDDYLQMLDSSEDNFSDDDLYVVSDEDEQIKLDDGEMIMKTLSKRFEELQLQRGAKGQKKTYTSFIDHKPSTNWKRLKQRLEIENRTDISEQTGDFQVQVRAATRKPRDGAVKKPSLEENEKPNKTEGKKSIPNRNKKLNPNYRTTKDGSKERTKKDDKPMRSRQKLQDAAKNRKSQSTEKEASSSQPAPQQTIRKKKNFKHPTKLITKVSTA